MSDTLVTLFQNIGLSEAKAKETAKNKNLAPTLEKAILATGLKDVPRATGALLYHLASTITPGAAPHLEYISVAIRDSYVYCRVCLVATSCFAIFTLVWCIRHRG